MADKSDTQSVTSAATTATAASGGGDGKPQGDGATGKAPWATEVGEKGKKFVVPF